MYLHEALASGVMTTPVTPPGKRTEHRLKAVIQGAPGLQFAWLMFARPRDKCDQHTISQNNCSANPKRLHTTPLGTNFVENKCLCHLSRRLQCPGPGQRILVNDLKVFPQVGIPTRTNGIYFSLFGWNPMKCSDLFIITYLFIYF